MNAPHLARVTDHARRSQCGVGPVATDQGQAPGREQTLQPGSAHETVGGRRPMRREPGPSAGSAALGPCRMKVHLIDLLATGLLEGCGNARSFGTFVNRTAFFALSMI